MNARIFSTLLSLNLRQFVLTMFIIQIQGNSWDTLSIIINDDCHIDNHDHQDT